MADQSDVETALAGLVGAALYPGGIAALGAVPGAVVRIYRGFPLAAGLDADLAAARSNVSISASDGATENTTRWPDLSLPQAVAVPSLFANVAGITVTFSGAAGPGQVAAVIADTATVAYRSHAGDTPASVAAALARLLQPLRVASAIGAVLTVPSTLRLVARVAADQSVLRITRRQRQTFKVSCWCPDPATRDAVGSAIDAALSGVDFLGLADGTSGRLLAVSSSVSDRWEDAALYRRELIYSVEYATTIAQSLPRMTVGIATERPAGVASLS